VLDAWAALLRLAFGVQPLDRAARACSGAVPAMSRHRIL